MGRRRGTNLSPKEFSPAPWLALQGLWSQGGALCAHFDFGDIPGELKEKGPYGTNMAFRKEMFEKHGGFRVDLGRCGDSLIGNEDTEFGRRLMAAGERLRYEPSAIVYHSIAEERLNKSTFRSWWFAFGRAQMREKGAAAEGIGNPALLFQSSEHCFASLLPQIVRSLLARDPQERFSRQCNAYGIAGTMTEIWNMARNGRYTARPQQTHARENGAFTQR